MTIENAETLPAVRKPKHTGTHIGDVRSLAPKDYAEAKTMALDLSKSELVPKDMIGKPANILIALMFGNELGLSPAQTLTSVFVVNGRPTLFGDAVMGKIKASDVYESSKDEFDEKTMTATFSVKRKGEDWLVRSFSKVDAEKAGLWGKAGPWSSYPKRMLFQRARAFAARDAFPDILRGLRITEEERDIIDVTASVSESVEMPRRASEAMAVAPAVPGTAIASPGSPETHKVSIQFAKIQKMVGAEPRWKASGKDGVDYMLGIEAFALAIRQAIEKGHMVDVEYEEADGFREVFTVLVQIPKAE